MQAAVDDARANAAANQVHHATFRCTRVEHDLDDLDAGAGHHLVVDPPRAGLHPSVAKKLAQVAGHTLVYVACKPASLGRDAAILEAGGWRMTDLWVVDLFPQTGHVEAVARFVRSHEGSGGD